MAFTASRGPLLRHTPRRLAVTLENVSKQIGQGMSMYMCTRGFQSVDLSAYKQDSQENSEPDIRFRNRQNSPVHVGGFHKIVASLERSAALPMGLQGFAGCLDTFGNEDGGRIGLRRDGHRSRGHG